MKSSKQLVPFFAATLLLTVATAQAARVDMKDPRRSVGREENIRVDAELFQDAVSNSSPINITYQVQNLTDVPVAIADKSVVVSFDDEERTITLSVGDEIPQETMPHLVIIPPHTKKTLTAGGVLSVALPALRTTRASMYVQVRVNVLRDLTPFQDLLTRARTSPAVPIPTALFDTWIDATDTILCNTIPVRWDGRAPRGDAPTAEQRMPSVGTW
jgi:Flp pilus assembly protein TadG